MKKETLNIANCIEMDRDKAKSFLNKKGVYRQPGVFIEKWKIPNEYEYYIASLEKNKFSYLGILNSKLKREKYGINTFENGDKYIGNFANDKREENGIYIYSPFDSKEFLQNEMYIGSWKENVKFQNGMYIWLKDKKDSPAFETSNLDVFMGEIDKELMKRGCYLSKVQNKYFAYFGKFNNNGLKNDDKAYFYDYSKDKVFCGKILDNKFLNGYLMFKSKDGLSLNIIYIEFDEKDNVSIHKNHENIEDGLKAEYIKSMSKFREVLLQEDYFRIIYNKEYEIKSFISGNSIDASIFNDETQYLKILDISSFFKDLNLFQILENSQL